jgi:hypothetical protein
MSRIMIVILDTALSEVVFLLKNAVFWDEASCRYRENRRCGASYRDSASEEQLSFGYAKIAPHSLIPSSLNMEATLSSESSVLTRPTRCHIAEDGFLHNSKLKDLARSPYLSYCYQEIRDFESVPISDVVIIQVVWFVETSPVNCFQKC